MKGRLDSNVYTESFYKRLKQDDNKRKAFRECYVPDLMRLFNPASVIDVGCGVGVLLKEFENKGITLITGIDGENAGEELLIPKERFVGWNLNNIKEIDSSLAQEKYDLACCLEVAEHVRESAAKDLIAFLCEKSDVVFFSAAVPMQMGDGHINEQWPEYWEKKYNSNGYIRCDYFRRKYWDCQYIPGYYRQNILLYIKESVLDKYSELKKYSGDDGIMPKHVIHPTVYGYSVRHSMDQFDISKYPRKELVEENVSNGRLLLNREVLLNRVPKGGVMCEVGVACGDFSKKMIEICQPKKLYCIDIWDIDHPDYGEIMRERYEKTLQNLDQYIKQGIVEIMRGDSAEELELLQDNSLDFVYIDAMHDYEHPKRELSICSRKVKKEGMIAGHDYTVLNPFEKPLMQYGVMNAVNEFMVDYGYEMIYFTLEGLYITPSYCLKKMGEKC